MFSSLSSYIWGEETQNGQGQEFNPTLPDNVKASRDQSPDDWVLVGETASPAPGNLTGALPPLPGDSTPCQSSSASSEAGDAEAAVTTAPEPSAVTSSRHRQTPVSIAAYQAKKELKSAKAAQLLKRKNSGKAMTSKALNRSNKTVYSPKSKKHQFRQNLNLKMAGANKNLKQC